MIQSPIDIKLISQIDSSRGRYYYYPDAIYGSVTTILKIIRKEWLEKWMARVGEATASMIAFEAANLGQQVHYIIEQVNKVLLGTTDGEERVAGIKKVVEENSDYQTFVWGYLEWYEKNVERILFTEQIVFNPVDGYVGRCDFGCILKQFPSQICLCDMKITSNSNPETSLQLSAYYRGLLISGGLSGMCTAGYEDTPVLLELKFDKTNGGELVPTQLGYDYPTFLHALGLWLWREKAEKASILVGSRWYSAYRKTEGD